MFTLSLKFILLTAMLVTIPILQRTEGGIAPALEEAHCGGGCAEGYCRCGNTCVPYICLEP